MGADGYLGRVTTRYLRDQGHHVDGLDNYIKQSVMAELGIDPLYAVIPDNIINRNARDVGLLVNGYDCIIDYAELPSAPYSMRGHREAALNIENNTLGTLGVAEAIRQHNPDCHLIKLGTMGEYGTPNIDIEEGWLEVDHNGRRDRMLYPKKPGSMYHLSKVFDSDLLEFYCRIHNLRVTDLNQGVVYGYDKDTHFYYDETFGTCLNRFIVQAVAGIPLTIYGNGTQTRGWLNIKDVLQCVHLAILNPAEPGEFKVRNQFTEQFSVADLARKVHRVGNEMGLSVSLSRLENPRKEQENHYYHASNSSFVELGLQPNRLTDDVISDMICNVMDHRTNIKTDQIKPTTKWKRN